MKVEKKGRKVVTLFARACSLLATFLLVADFFVEGRENFFFWSVPGLFVLSIVLYTGMYLSEL
ncbi:hypothetical protein JZO70_07710 [Enterococcus sp. 669A]|uniref:Uncharacterized protein n=1 Tax=Candidatus Enterococcus moelleringii TaxID=2815325 RepID=A0ABS3L8T4_9ENTE|nr:hypothetical protein [Enterococcus sp. 669A]MBO1306042.1 hypothetical protein [Enterococcus sp. 669A]